MTETSDLPQITDHGERMIPDIHHDATVYAEHMVRYRFAMGFVAGKRVLDVASGSGYGCEMLKAAGATEVVGVDYSPEAAKYAAERYGSRQPHYLIGDAESLPFSNGEFDVVVSFETIEHLSQPERFLESAKRVLRPDGLLVVSTPNRGVFVEGNPFHLHEFTFDELEECLKRSFKHVETYAQDDWITSAILDLSDMETADFALRSSMEVYKATARPPSETLYMVSLCSDAPLPAAAEHAVMTGLYEMKGFMQEIDRLNSGVSRLEDERSALERGVEERRQEVNSVKRELQIRQGELEGAMRRIADIEQSVGWRALNRIRPYARIVAPRGSLRYNVLLKLGKWGLSVATLRPLRLVVRARLGRTGDGAKSAAARHALPKVKPLRVGCYGEHCWSVGGGTVHALQLLIPLLPYFDVELLLPPGTPLRGREWYKENLLIDIGAMKVRHYTAGAENTYDVWLSVWNEKIWPAATPKRFNMVFFPFVALDGSGFVHITNSRYSAGYLRERYQTNDIVVAPPCVSVDEFRAGPKEPMILHVSRFAMPSAFADKAHIMMIQAFKQLCDRGLRGWRFVLAGATIDEGEETYVNHLAKHAHGYPIEFVRNLSASELRDTFARASIYWHATGYSVREPAAQEHFGITILEGMAAGAVPMSYNSGGPPEIITDGESGYLFDTLEQLVQRTWDVAHDPSLWKRLSTAARERAGFFSPQYVSEVMLAAVCKTQKVSIIMGTHSNLPVLRRALESILKHTPPGYELIVVDNASEDGTGVYLASLDYPHLKVIRNEENKSFGEFNNQGQKIATREYILYLNDDVEVFPGWIEPLVEVLDANPKVGAVGSRLLYPDGRVQHDGKMFRASDLTPYHVNMGGQPVSAEGLIEVDALTAACLMVRRELAGYSEDYKRGYYEDTDLCMRIKEKGYALVLHRGSVLIHYHGMTMGRNQTATEEAQKRNRDIFLQRWSAKLPDIVYLASETEMEGKEIRCRPVFAPGQLAAQWPTSRRLS